MSFFKRRASMSDEERKLWATLGELKGRVLAAAEEQQRLHEEKRLRDERVNLELKVATLEQENARLRREAVRHAEWDYHASARGHCSSDGAAMIPRAAPAPAEGERKPVQGGS